MDVQLDFEQYCMITHTLINIKGEVFLAKDTIVQIYIIDVGKVFRYKKGSLIAYFIQQWKIGRSNATFPISILSQSFSLAHSIC